MLRTRVLTALVLLGILILVVTVARPWGFPLFALLAVGLVISEWLSLLGLSRMTTVVTAAVMAFVLWIVGESAIGLHVATIVMALAAIAWVALSLGLFVTGRFPAADGLRLPHAVLALLLPSACWFALVAAYREGLVFLASILAIVWAADIAAYFAGRAFGKRKLAPAISPGKTWAGAIGGAIAAIVVATIATSITGLSGSFFSVVETRTSLVVMLAIVFVIVVLSIVGDLFESQLKRQHGVKDSGKLLPGHGGVYDRVDALIPTMPVAVLVALVWTGVAR